MIDTSYMHTPRRRPQSDDDESDMLRLPLMAVMTGLPVSVLAMVLRQEPTLVHGLAGGVGFTFSLAIAVIVGVVFMFLASPLFEEIGTITLVIARVAGIGAGANAIFLTAAAWIGDFPGWLLGALVCWFLTRRFFQMSAAESVVSGVGLYLILSVLPYTMTSGIIMSL